MRVLQLNTESTWRGGERQTLYTIKGLLDAGVEVGLLCRRGSPMAQRASLLGIEVHETSGQAAAVRWLAGPRPRGYDLLHAQSAKAHSLAAMTKPLHRRPILHTRRVNFVQKGAWARLKYRLTDRTVAISRAIRETLAGQGLREVPVISSAVHERPLNLARAEELRARLGLLGKKVVATTGDLVPQKGPEVMVRAIAELKKLRDDFRFLHFGNTQMASTVKPLIQQLGLEDHYLLLGHQDSVEDYFALFDAFLISSIETEGLCSSVYDAFVYKVPVVSTLAGGLHDSVADRGFTCANRDHRCLGRQLHHVLEHPEEAAERAEGAYRWAQENVTIPAITEKYLALYRELLAGQ